MTIFSRNDGQILAASEKEAALDLGQFIFKAAHLPLMHSLLTIPMTLPLHSLIRYPQMMTVDSRRRSSSRPQGRASRIARLSFG